MPSRKLALQNTPYDVGRFLKLAIQLATGLGELHRKGMVYGEIHPDNILISPDGNQICLSESDSSFTIAEHHLAPPTMRQPAPPEYRSPEQFGHFSRPIDQRSDLYSLGVVFYQMVTGSLPFRGEQAADWAYLHFTRTPKAPHELQPDLPQPLSAIILKLLKKDPEERYQSVDGLLADLEECQRQWLVTGSIAAFPVGQKDQLARFRLPTKFYGRQKEIHLLQAAFDRVLQGGTETILISGEAGVGKTSLIHESFRHLAERKGTFVTGKADQLRQNIPYALFTQAFGRFIRRLLTEEKKQLLWWKKRIQGSLGKNGAVLLPIIPELKWMIGHPSPAEPLPPQEAENRLQMVFSQFIQGCAEKHQPLVLFLDDLQWADEASIRLLKYLMRDHQLSSVLMIGAFRDRELGDHHLLQNLLTEPYHQQSATHLALLPLERAEMAHMVAETLHAPLESVVPLSDSLYHKSGGNPFTLKQLLSLLHEEGALYFDHQTGSWKWDAKAFSHLYQGEDDLDLILTKLQRLPDEEQELLKIASCLGNRFDLETVAALWARPMEETAAGLMSLVSEGLLLIAERENEAAPVHPSGWTNVEFAFLHDHIQQAVYSLISEEEKKERHFQIGSFLMEKRDAAQSLAGRLMAMMDHFNRSLELIQDPIARLKLARLNLRLGRKAKASAAYESARKYVQAGIFLLPEEPWKAHYRLAFNLYLELAQAEFLSGDADKAEELFDMLVKKARTELERADVYSLKVILYAGIGQYAEAVETGRKALQKLGVHLPLHPTKRDYLKELLRYKWFMRNKKIEDLLHLPEMTAPVQRKIAQLLTRLSYITMISYPDLFGLLILVNGNYALRYGNHEMSAVGFLGFGIMTGTLSRDYQKGEKYGQLCIRLAEKYDRNASKCIIYFTTGTLISHWTHHASHGLKYLNKAVQSGMEAGDVVIVGYAHSLLLENQFLMGVPMADIKEELRQKRQWAETLKHDNLLLNTSIYAGTINALTGQEPTALERGIQQLEKDEPVYAAQKDKSGLATYYCSLMQLYYLAGRPDEALQMANKIQPLLGSIEGLLLEAHYAFYKSLAMAAVCRHLSPASRTGYRRQLNKELRKLKKWAASCRENFLHKYLLVKAEIARLDHRNEEAMALYDQAITAAQTYGYRQDEALANELAAKFYLSLGRARIADVYWKEAIQAYQRWGALAIVHRLTKAYPHLAKAGGEALVKQKQAKPFERKSQPLPTGEEGMATPLTAHLIDQALDIITKESDTNLLLEKFLAIILESVGADKGCLLFEKNGELYIEALKDTATNLTLIQTMPLEQAQDLARAVIYYVARTLETVILNSGEPYGIFASDPYLAESHPKSIACIPLLLQGVPFGVLYLENNQMPRLFDSQQLKVLHLLSSQFAFVKKLESILDAPALSTEETVEVPAPLTERELEVLKLIGQGFSNNEIGEKLDMSINTVKTHIKNIYGKLGVKRRTQAVQKAKIRGLI